MSNKLSIVGPSRLVGRICLASALIMLGAINPAKAGVINFDVDPTNAPIANGAMINDVYSSMGVTLSSIHACPTCATPTVGNAYAVSETFGSSSPNVFGINATGVPLFDNRWGVGVVKFDTLQQYVGIYAAAVPFVENLSPNLAKPYLSAYDSNGVFLGAILYPVADGQADYGSFQKLFFDSGSANIAEVHFGSEKPSQYVNSGIVYGEFDDLAFGGDVSNGQSAWNLLSRKMGPGPSNGPDTVVPEPATLALMIVAIGATGLARRRKSMTDR